MKNLDELKAYLVENSTGSNDDLSTPSGVDKQFKNRMYNNACIFYVKRDDKGFSIEKFYCDKNGNAITKETFEKEKNSIL